MKFETGKESLLTTNHLTPHIPPLPPLPPPLTATRTPTIMQTASLTKEQQALKDENGCVSMSTWTKSLDSAGYACGWPTSAKGYELKATPTSSSTTWLSALDRAGYAAAGWPTSVKGYVKAAPISSSTTWVNELDSAGNAAKECELKRVAPTSKETPIKVARISRLSRRPSSTAGMA